MHDLRHRLASIRRTNLISLDRHRSRPWLAKIAECQVSQFAQDAVPLRTEHHDAFEPVPSRS